MDRQVEALRGAAWWQGATRVALGRHALALVARDLRRHGVRQVAVPDHHCLTMTLPLQMEGLRLAHVRVGADLLPDPDDLLRVVAGSARPQGGDPGAEGAVPSAGSGDPRGTRGATGVAPGWALLLCETFGAAPSPRLARVLRTLLDEGAHLVLDATHTWPLVPRTLAALPDTRRVHCVASVRKLAALPDGALVTGLPAGAAADLGRRDVDRAATRRWLEGDVEGAEDLMEDQLEPAAMSPEASAMLAATDLSALLARHRRGARLLTDALGRRGITPLSPPGAHFCVALRAPHPGAVEELARRGVDGPVWWPRPRGWVRDWPTDLLTLPTDGVDQARATLTALADVLGDGARGTGDNPRGGGDGVRGTGDNPRRTGIDPRGVWDGARGATGRRGGVA